MAAVFVLFLVAEWGSHGVICSTPDQADGTYITATEDHREDPCDTLVLCSDTRGRDRQTVSSGHNAVQHNGVLDGLFSPVVIAALRGDPPLFSSTANRLFRPPNPPFHPPKLT